jgi:hypothetical protein
MKAKPSGQNDSRNNTERGSTVQTQTTPRPGKTLVKIDLTCEIGTVEVAAVISFRRKIFRILNAQSLNSEIE